MKRFKLYSDGIGFIRFIAYTGVVNRKVCVFDCLSKKVIINEPEAYSNYVETSEQDLWKTLKIDLTDFESLEKSQKRIARERYNIISPILPFVEEPHTRANLIRIIAERNNLSTQSVRKYLFTYLSFVSLTALVPHIRNTKKELTQLQKNIRWALNKYYYTSEKHSLYTAYELLLKAKYLDENGKLIDKYPKFHQFVYFYKKTKKLSNQLISRNGLSDYQRNHRLLLGRVCDLAPHPGLAMVDATVLDIYLINESKQLVGRPYLYLMVDAFSTMILAYYLGWEGGFYGVRQMLNNCVTDKVKHCEIFGLNISKEQWNVSKLPSKILTDRGSEFFGTEFSQLTDLGIEIINAPSYRAELKGPVEKTFDLLQRKFKPHLIHQGVVNPDFQKRGARDYRKDAKLTLEQFEKILVRCIVSFNTTRIIKLSYITDLSVKPFAYDVFNKGIEEYPESFIDVDNNYLNLLLLPRVTGIFKRDGLEVFKLHYKRNGFNDLSLVGKKVIVAYQPENTSRCWLFKPGEFLEFTLIDTAYSDVSFYEAENVRKNKQGQFKSYESVKIQSDLDLISSINSIASTSNNVSKVALKNIKNTRENETTKTHKTINIRGEDDE